MSFRKVFFFVLVLAFGSVGAARAQFGVYGLATGERFSSINCPTFAVPCASTTGSVKPYGGTFGVQYDFLNLGPVRIGADLRGDILTANKRADSTAGGRGVVRDYAALGGIRASVRSPIHAIHPYVEVAAGFTRNNAIAQYTVVTSSPLSVNYNPEIYSNYILVKGFVGLDVTIVPWMDLRAVELGVGEAFGTGTAASNGYNFSTPGAGTHGTQSVGAGLVFHLPR